MRIVQSDGMGVESTAILLRWIFEPESRDFDLRDLTVLTAQVGDEFPDTTELRDRHLLPLLRKHRIRYVQVARKGHRQAEGVEVLDDSRAPERTIAEGAGYSLSDEMTRAGTVPQRRMYARTCSQHFKKFPLETWLGGEFGDASYRHIMGFNAEETRRAERDTSYSSPERSAEYPLIQWGWGRQTCEDYIHTMLGVRWEKSCCYFCPFMNNESGLPRALERLARYPKLAAKAAVMERLSRSLNPRQTLFGGKRGGFEETLEDAGCCCDCVSARDQVLASEPWALYRSRKVFVSPTHASRDLQVVFTGSYHEALWALKKTAGRLGREIESDGRFHRVWVSHKETTFPCMEELAAIAPAWAHAKRGPAFGSRMKKLESARAAATEHEA